MPDTDLSGDAELVKRCLSGDRGAFGRIVERYQSLVCALAYSACGDLARSEDLAQETLLAAWRQLGTLEEPAKLKQWLCGILRNLIRNSLRSQSRNPLAAAVELKDEWATGPDWNAPSDQAMSKEEEAILWRSLERIPETYREPLVLFYREHQSIERVAEELELSEDAVKQRLSRGRKLLHEQVMAFVEGALERTNPGKAFTLAVLAALPLTSAQAGVAATTAAATAQGAGTLKAASGVGGFVAAVANAVPILGGVIGLWGRIENSRSQRERRFLTWSTVGFVVCAVVWILALVVGMGLLLQHQVVQFTTRLSDAIGFSLLWLGLAAPLDAYVIWMARRQMRIRTEQTKTEERPVEAARRGYRLCMYGAMLGMVFGTTEWLFLLAHHAQDWATIRVLLLVDVTVWLVSANWAVKRPAIRAQVFIALWWGLMLMNLVTANWRWGVWQAGSEPLAPPGVNLLIFVCFASLRAGWYLKQRLLTSRAVGRDSLVALAIYAVVTIAGVAWFRVARAAEVREAPVTHRVVNDIQTDGTVRFQHSTR